MKVNTRWAIVFVTVLVSLPGLAQAHQDASAGRATALLTTPLATGFCHVALTESPVGSVDVNQTLTLTAAVDTSLCTGATYYGYSWSLPANCSSPAASTYPNLITSPTVTFGCHPRYFGNVSAAQQATYYDYVYNITVTATGCTAPSCGAPGDPAFTVGNYSRYVVYGEPRLMPGGTKATSLAAEVGVNRWLNTYFPLGLVGIDKTLSKNWLIEGTPAGGDPGALAFDSVSDQLFIANSGSGYNVSAYSVNEGLIAATIPVGSDPIGLAMADGKLFVSNQASNNLSVINPQTDKVTGTIAPVTAPRGIVYDSINNYLYVADASYTGPAQVTVINATSDAILGSIHLPGFEPWHLGYDPSTHEVYATNDYSGSGTPASNITAIYTAPGSIGTPVLVINVGGLPSAVGYSSVSHDIYVTNMYSSTVSIISDSTNLVIKTIGVGKYPTDITTWALDEGHLFMSNIGSANITVINTTTNSVQFNFGDPAFGSSWGIVDYGDLALISPFANMVTTVQFQNSTIPEFGSGLGLSPLGTQGGISWYSNDTKAVPTLSCDPPIPDRYCLINPVLPANVTLGAFPFDSNGGDSYFGATNVTFHIHVYPRLQAGALVSNHSAQGGLVADVANPISLMVNVVNGTGPGTYTTKWSGLPSGCVSSNATRISCTPAFKTAGTYTVSVSVRDPLGGALTRTNTLMVYPDPKISLIAASNRSAYTNTSLFVNPAVTGGAPPYSFCVSAASSTSCAPVTRTNSTDLSYTISQPGTYPVSVSVQDAAGVVRTYTFNEQVAYLPRVVNVVGPSQADAGQNLTFTAQLPSGYGIAPLNVSWTNSNTGQVLCPTQTHPTSNVTSRCSFSPGSSVNIAVTVNDSAGSSWTSYSSLIVHPDPAVTLGDSSGLPGKPIAVDVQLSGGVSPYTVCLTYPKASCVKVANGVAIFNVTYTKPGYYILNVSVNDSLGENISATGIVSVYSPMKLGSISVSPNPVDGGVTEKFNASVLGGSPNFETWWNESGSGTLCAGPTLTTCSSPLTGNGHVTVSLTVADSFGEIVFQNTSVTVNNHLSVTLPTETLTLGRQGWLNGTVSGGTAPYSWVLSGVPGSVDHGSSGTLSIQATFASPGNYSLYFQVSDQGGGEVTMVWQVSVVPSASSQLVAPCAPQGPKSLHPMENGAYNVTCASGGTSPYNFAWIWGDSTVTQGNSSATHHFEAAGYYNITVMVRDASGSVAFTRALEVVVSGQAIQGPPSLPCAPTGPSTLTVGAKGEYSITCATGGVAPYVYTWEFQDGTTTAANSTVSHQFSKTGTFRVTVLVTDALGRVATSTPLSVTVKTSPTPSGNSVWSNMAGSSVLYPLLLVVFASAAIVYLAVRKHRRKDSNQENGASSRTEESTPVEDRDIKPKES